MIDEDTFDVEGAIPLGRTHVAEIQNAVKKEYRARMNLVEAQMRTQPREKVEAWLEREKTNVRKAAAGGVASGHRSPSDGLKKLATA